MSGYKFFSFTNRLQLFLYSIGNRLVNRTPRGLKNTYEFVRTNNRYVLSKKGNNIVLQFEENSKPYTIHLPENSSDPLVFKQIFEGGEYTRVVNILQTIVSEELTIIDAGANVGYTTLYLKAYFPQARIFALEPISGTYERLRNNIQINKLEGVEVIQKGLWNKTTYLGADYSFRDGQDWSFRLVEVEDKTKSLIATYSIPDLLQSYQIKKVDFLKIDIEGGEKTVFQGDVSWLNQVKMIAIEIHDEFDCRELIEGLLREYNFELSYSGELTIGINRQ